MAQNEHQKIQYTHLLGKKERLKTFFAGSADSAKHPPKTEHDPCLRPSER